MENADKHKLKFTGFGVLEDRYSYINPTRMFYAYFGILLNNINISGVNYKMVRKAGSRFSCGRIVFNSCR